MDKAVLVVIIVNVLFSIKGFKDRVFFEKFKFQIAPIKKGENIRLLSSGFLHVDQAHLFFNMFTLYIFADSVIAHIGIIKFIIIYFQ